MREKSFKGSKWFQRGVFPVPVGESQIDQISKLPLSETTGNGQFCTVKPWKVWQLTIFFFKLRVTATLPHIEAWRLFIVIIIVIQCVTLWLSIYLMLKADFLLWQKLLASSLRVPAANFALLSSIQWVFAVWLKIFCQCITRSK